MCRYYVILSVFIGVVYVNYFHTFHYVCQVKMG